MTTKFVGVKEFRQNIAKYAKVSKRNKQRLVILNRNIPILEVRPISNEENFTIEFEKKIKQGLADTKAGRIHSHKEVMAKFGLK